MNRFVSALAPQIQGLLEVKHAMGLPYEASERHLWAFDIMCAKHYPGQRTLSREMVMEWVVKRSGEHVNGQIRRITPIRQLAKHIASLGGDAYVIPAGIPGGQIHYHPHIYSHQELRALFDAADAIRPTPYGGQRQLIIPVVFRMIYCLGLRPGEARKLHRNDVDLAHGSVLIRESKGHKDRVVFMSPDLHAYCRHYDAAIGTFHPDRIPFFPNHRGDFYSKGTPDRWFRELLSTVGPLIMASPGSPPRPYDLRHAHVIEVINRGVRAGKSPDALVAYLSLHLGHSNTEDTWYYFHLAADFHPELRSLANATIEALFPEAHHDIR
ncbi:integrase [Arthrobacter silviterrae]|uniref:Tyrosine-type recombinase/integrase n=1 Tax=Arthrobacter silviterrae TaxID=2026658 RepID=A0ABX0DFA1_9MICC|nr:tyrosine-type recombinase/integrase [Arthrobacter silviterrae]MDQ0277127.1 integrase [Arthrobacter silviterrae]MDQ0277358.1 integrase [Arthrobacter silviterrae]MDQ0277418.1 integrase [Arthrobacter silviterrae]MDQ0277499.1 integrase [Arthrobacter silviterrae]NGN85589.1 tyrosine-type recombinase/integrase [Arthrobacter silviterrae]